MHYLEQQGITQDLIALRDRLRIAMPDNPIHAGWASYSQCDEDGIIRDCLTRIHGTLPRNGTCIEIGCSDGLENNTHQLLLDGYSGFWVEGDKTKIEYLRDALGGLRFDRLFVKEAFVTLDNVADLVREAVRHLGTREFDFLTLDVDGNDLHLMRAALADCSPRLVCVEYNAKFPPPSRLVMRYDAAHVWRADDFFGASLQSWIDALSGYTLVCCNLSGANAFFVRSDLAGSFSKYSAAELYQPPRYWLANGSVGHENSLKWLRQSLNVPL